MKTQGYFMSEPVAIKMNLYQKLVEVRKAVIFIEKGDAGYNFKYANSADLLGKIRPVMDDLGVLLVTDMTHFSRQGASEAGKAGMTVTLSYTWVNADNPAEQLRSSLTFFEDKMTGCQGIGSILTYGERYFLYKFLNVATDKEAPEQFYKDHGLSAFAEEEPPKQAVVQETKQQPRKVFRHTLDFWFDAAPRLWALLRKNDDTIYQEPHQDLPYYLHQWQLDFPNVDLKNELVHFAKQPKEFLAGMYEWLDKDGGRAIVDEHAHKRAYEQERQQKATA